MNNKIFIYSIKIMSLMLIPHFSIAQTQCQNIFLKPSIDEVIISLAKLHLKLELAKVQGNSSLTLTALDHDYKVKYKKLVAELKANNTMTATSLNQKIKTEIKKQQFFNEKKAIDENKNRDLEKMTIDPVQISQKIIFNDIQPGFFGMGISRINTEITKPFAMMATQVTQLMWAKLMIVMGERNLQKINPSHFTTGTESKSIKIENISLQIKLDHPVEQVNLDDVNEFLRGLNRLSNSNDSIIQSQLENLIPGHKVGDHYDLPTEAQWEFIMTNTGQTSERYFDDSNGIQMENYTWFSKNSNKQTHQVATLQPRVISGKAFYDLQGNVHEWTKDQYNWELAGGKDPLEEGNYSTYAIRGGSWSSELWSLRSTDRGFVDKKIRGNNLGFRLIRTRL